MSRSEEIDGIPLADVMVRCEDGRELVRGYRLFELAVTPMVSGRGLWTITHLPTGATLGTAHAVWETPEPAIRAMREVLKLRNDWVNLPPGHSEANLELYEAVRSVCLRHGGDMPIRFGAPLESLDPTMNGYQGGAR